MQIARSIYLIFSRPGFTDISNPGRGFNIRWRAISFAASAPSDTPKFRVLSRRISKDERRAMVESFVNKYRALNSGKFPSVSDVKKEVGGGYYFIRKIVQELEYKSKLASTNTSETSLVKEAAKDNELSTEVKVVLNSYNTRYAKIDEDANARNEISSSKEVENKNETSSEAAEVSSCQMEVHARVDEDAQTGNKTLLVKKEIKGNETSIETREVLNNQMILDEENDKRDHLLFVKGVPSKAVSATKVKEVSSSQMTEDVFIYTPTIAMAVPDIDGSSDKHFAGKEEKRTLILAEKISVEVVPEPKTKGEILEHDASQGDLHKEQVQEAFYSDPQNLGSNIVERRAAEDMLDFGGPENRAHQPKLPPELGKFGGDLTEEQIHDEGLKKKSSLWGKLKSLADGIIDVWRKF